MESNLCLIKKESDIFGLLFLGDGATISTAAVLYLVDCQVHSADGGENDGTLICNRFPENIRKIDLHKSITDVVMFDGA